MATILRSSRYMRNILELITNVGFSHVNYNIHPIHLVTADHLRSRILRAFTVQASANVLDHHVIQENTVGNKELEAKLHVLDNSARRFGKVSERILREAVEKFQSAMSVTSTQSLMLLRCCGNLLSEEVPETRTKLVNEIWQIIENSGVEMSLGHYNALLRVYLENEYPFSPTEVLATLENKGIEPNKLTYQRLIDRYCQQGDTEGATKILEFMRDKQISVNERIFTSLVRGHSEAGDMTSAADILSLMEEAGFAPTADTYKELLCGYGKHGDMESIKQTLDKCKGLNIHLLSTDFFEVIHSLVRNGHTQYVAEIIAIIPKDVGYVQEALHNILKLTNCGQVDAAMQVLASIPERSGASTGTSTVKQIAKCNVSPGQLADLCKAIIKKGINSHALLIALEISLLQGNVERSLVLLDALKDTNQEIREHYFWPIFIELGKSRNDEGIDDLLSKMKHQYHVTPISRLTLSNYVLPHKIGGLDKIMADLSLCGLPNGTISCAITYNLINEGNLKAAADFGQKYRFHYNAVLFQRPLIEALNVVNDIDSYVNILHNIYQSEISLFKNRNYKNPNDIINPYICEIPTFIRENPLEKLTAILKLLPQVGLTISDMAIASLRQTIGENMTSELNEILALFKSEQLPTRRKQESQQGTMGELEYHLGHSSASTNANIRMKSRLLRMYCATKSIDKMESLLKVLDNGSLEFSHGTLSNIIEAYCSANLLDKAEHYIQLIEEKYPKKVLENKVLHKYIILLIKHDRVDDAVKIASRFRDGEKNDRSFVYGWWRLLNEVADLGKPEAVRRLFDMALKNEYINISSQMLGPLVNVHLVRDDSKAAVDACEQIWQTYKLTPMKNKLSKKLIKDEDVINLQRLTDLSTQVHGEANSLYDLAQSFIENDCIRQARKILEIPLLHSKTHRLQTFSARYRDLRHTRYLENLITTLIEIPHFNTITSFYDDLLTCYADTNDWQKALNLWQRLNDTEIRPSPTFFGKLAHLLLKNGQTVPFPMTDPQIQLAMQSQLDNDKDKDGSRTPESRSRSRTREQSSSPNGNKTYLNVGSAETQKLEELYDTIRSLANKKQYTEVFQLVEHLLEDKTNSKIDVFKFVLKIFASAGEIDLIVKLGKQMDSSQLRRANFYNNLCHAHITAEKIDDYLNKLEAKLETTDKSEVNQMFSVIPILNFRRIMAIPEFEEKCIRIAKTYAERGIWRPMNAVWIHYFMNNHPEAEMVWTKYMSKHSDVSFDAIIRTATSNDDPDLLWRLIKTIETSPTIKAKSKGIVYSKLIKIFNTRNDYENGSKILKAALNHLTINELDSIIVQNLELGLKSSARSSSPDTIDRPSTT